MNTVSSPMAAARRVSYLAPAIAKHQAARAAWRRASTASEVAAARNLSRVAAAVARPRAGWLEELDAACIDAEAGHAIDLHTQAIAKLRARPRRAAS